MKAKKLIALTMSIILCLLIYTPAYATIPSGSVEHTVTILSGNGKLLKNKDETYADNHITLNDLDDLDQIDEIQYQVVDGENLKDMIDYSNADGTIYTATMNDKLIAKLNNIPSGKRPRWREVGFITSTRVANHLLSLVEAAGYEFTSGYTDLFDYLPVGVQQLLVFLPNEEGYSFSHFEDQDGNKFSLSTPITRDIVLTPVYTSEPVIDSIDKTEDVFHQVRFLSGEGKIEYVKLQRNWDEGYNYCEGYREIEYFDDIVIDGKRVTDRSDVIQSFAILQSHDFPVAFNLLLEKEADCIEHLNNKDLIGAIFELDESIEIASKFMFSSPYYYQEEVRPYSISLLAFLSNFTINSEKLSDVLINLLLDMQTALLNWNNYSDEEKDSFISECLDTISAFENTARSFQSTYYAYMTPNDNKEYRFSGTNLEYWVRDDIYHLYHETDEFDRASLYDGFAPTNKIVFIPPEGYEFDHFEDQYGNVFEPDTVVTEDLVLTPIFRELHEYHLTITKGEGDMRLYYRSYNEETHRSESTNDPIDEVSIRFWRDVYSYEIERKDGLHKMSGSNYTDIGLKLRGVTFEESLYAKQNWEQITVYDDYDNILFIPPDNCVFDHFEDETGTVWEFGTELTKDTVVTPIYKSTLIDATINVVTEDNSNEEFDITLLRSFKNNLEELFDKGDYDGTLQEYLNDKNSYHFNENDWIIDENGFITKYIGDFDRMLGIPDSINGIKVTGVATDAFEEFHEKYFETNPDSDESEFFYTPIALWIPKTVTNFSEGISNEGIIQQYKDSLFSEIRSQLEAEGKTEEEQETILRYYEDVISLTIEESGTNDATPLIYLPISYVVVEDGNKNYVSRAGSLYTKDYSTLLYISCAAKLDNLGSYGSYTFETVGLEIPSKVEKISAFATFNAVYQEYSGFYPIYAYGNTTFQNYLSYLVLKLNFPEENFIEELCMNKFGMTMQELEEKINFFYNPPDESEEAFDRAAQEAFADALAAGVIDENGDPTGTASEMVDFMLPYYTQWLDENPDYYFTDTALQLSMIKDGIIDVESGEYLVSESEVFAWQKAYIEYYSNGAITLDQEMNLIPNFTPEEREQIDAKLQIIADQNSLNLEETREGLILAYSIASFVMITNPENVETAREPFLELLHSISPDMSQEDIEENLEFFNMLVQSHPEYNGQINRYGKVSQANPFITGINFYDTYTYTAYLTDIPERYVTPEAVEIKPADNMMSGTIHLRLKRGNIEIETVDSNDTSRQLEADYIIYDSEGNEVARLSTTDGLIAGYGNLTYGTYTIVQTSVENGYMRNTDIKTASIEEDGDVIRVRFENHTINNMYSVRIPKTVVLDGSTGVGSCIVSVMGTIDSTRQITVTPEQVTFSLEEQNAVVDKKSPIEATIESNKTKWLSSDLSETEWSSIVWNISAPLTAGCWYGRTNIIIQIKEKE